MPQKPTRKAAPTAEEKAAKTAAADKAAVKKVAAATAVAAGAAAVAVAKTPKKFRAIALICAAVFVLLVVGGGLGWLLSPKATVNFYYVDDNSGYEPELLDTVKFRLFAKTTLAVPDYFESDDIADWAFEWFLDADCDAPAKELNVAFGDLGNEKNLYCILVFNGKEGAQTGPSLTSVEGGYTANIGNYYTTDFPGFDWTVEKLHERLWYGFSPTNYDFAGKGGGLISADTPDGTDFVYGIYTNQQFDPDWKSGKNFEREHVWCNSLLGMGRVTATGKNQASDLHNLRAIGGVYSGGINQTRSNRYFTECPDGASCTKGGANHTGHTVGTDAFYPGDDHVGDVARILMYMIVMYYYDFDKGMLYVNTDINAASAGSFFAGLQAYNAAHAYMPISDINLLKVWNARDKVDDFEMRRNDMIHRPNMQGNRNPFIDFYMSPSNSYYLDEIVDELLLRAA